ncbi:high-temperature-induced dauer-formation protein (macronuclear) [Tetrahymena thermophila SB210]|uniref:High-temperature-induced dauer-formation protein n=1 Tax=Tetrahymena thermophila (strain SB210) TaxID=312017 RepID=Q23MN0_TETTS|nr:high-temperature-induced dauer-formation protein [Tetrahymena thermophila SB210]EAR97812.3 high-temperature-induced dauer-formation protein [Tetrahymena thermophila SB210]|eukprot:XP_001018057.3 high-temperature-induced dauer-formation protein [Tetrahymena thermophila SB210]
MFQKAVTTLVFALLAIKGITFINFEQQSQTELYTQSWNLSLTRINSLQQVVLGEQKFDMTKYQLVSDQAQKQFMVNVGLFYIIAGFSIQYRAVLFRYLSGLIFMIIFFVYGINKKQFETNEYLEKYYHFALSLVFFFQHLIEPKLFSEKMVYKLLDDEKERMLKQIEASKVKKVKKNKDKQDQQETKEETQKRDILQEQQNQKEEVQQEEEQEEVESKNQDAVKSDKKEVNKKESDDDNQQEEKRKFQVDEDGFSVVPKKNIKKVQENRKNAKEKKKQMYDI